MRNSEPTSSRIASLVGITEREMGVGKLGWHGNSMGFDRKNTFSSRNHFYDKKYNQRLHFLFD